MVANPSVDERLLGNAAKFHFHFLFVESFPLVDDQINKADILGKSLGVKYVNPNTVRNQVIRFFAK